MVWEARLLKATVARMVLATHSAALIYLIYLRSDRFLHYFQAYGFIQKEFLLLGLFSIVVICVDLVFAIWLRRGYEGRSFSIVIGLHIMTIIIPVTLIETDRGFKQQHHAAEPNFELIRNEIDRFLTKSRKELREEAGNLKFNEDNLTRMILESELTSLILIHGFWLIFLTVRFLMPRGEVTRIALLKILYDGVYYGTDISDLLMMASDRNVILKNQSGIMILFWTISVFQFAFTMEAPEPSCFKNDTTYAGKLIGRKLWIILMQLFLQDGLFGTMRILHVALFRTYSPYDFFFVFKNGAVIILHCAKIIAIFNSTRYDTKLQDESENSVFSKKSDPEALRKRIQDKLLKKKKREQAKKRNKKKEKAKGKGTEQTGEETSEIDTSVEEEESS
ncbi:hypothetical protein SNEBB_009152 [Seison nebaliae]|nr:hypothetical protein SNEBB_009152 [Seison nebaliae]